MVEHPLKGFACQQSGLDALTSLLGHRMCDPADQGEEWYREAQAGRSRALVSAPAANVYHMYHMTEPRMGHPPLAGTPAAGVGVRLGLDRGGVPRGTTGPAERNGECRSRQVGIARSLRVFPEQSLW